MSKNDYLGLDGYTLRTFLTVLEEVSVSRAAQRLGISQSAVSHTLDKLRLIFDDPLFVRDGRGIEPTTRAYELRASAELVLDAIKSLTAHRHFDPLTEDMEFVVAANDFPVQLIFLTLLKELSHEGVNLRIRFIPSGIPSVGHLSASRYNLLITPTPPKDPDLKKTSLVSSRMAVFYDPNVRVAPVTWEEYRTSKHVDVRFTDTESSIIALTSADTSKLSPPVVTVANFSSLAPIIAGTDLITTQLDVMKRGVAQVS